MTHLFENTTYTGFNYEYDSQVRSSRRVLGRFHWCISAFGAPYNGGDDITKARWIYDTGRYIFRNEEDYVLFLLTWS